MIALSAKNAILIVEVAIETLRKGMSAQEAALHASHERFRPIVMTSIAFILGVVPLLTATGAGAVSRFSIGITVFSGMIASTTLAVAIVPIFFIKIMTFFKEGKDEDDEGDEGQAQAPDTLNPASNLSQSAQTFNVDGDVNASILTPASQTPRPTS